MVEYQFSQRIKFVLWVKKLIRVVHFVLVFFFVKLRIDSRGNLWLMVKYFFSQSSFQFLPVVACTGSARLKFLLKLRTEIICNFYWIYKIFCSNLMVFHIYIFILCGSTPQEMWIHFCCFFFLIRWKFLVILGKNFLNFQKNNENSSNTEPIRNA